MEHYYTPQENISANSLSITGDEARHLAKVLRKKTGEEINVTDGESNLYNCRIIKLNSELIECEIIEKNSGVNEPNLNITLYQSILKNPARFEFVIEKSVELGVNRIQPVITEHVVNKSADKTARWQSISLSAMKQSQRVVLPEVFHPVNFTDAIINCNAELKLIADEKDNNSELRIADCGFEKTKNIAVFIGPEGGFTDEEVKLAVDNEFKILILGKRKFRSETAAIAVLSKLLI